MGGRIIVESVAGCSWNGWPDDRGIRSLGALDDAGQLSACLTH
ncbi:periplasmic component [Pseudomonas syringae pv. actinidiae]|uniref:Periplasmic component n=1 Tax=Pseudomonas syringae pv. actinidiae TaxID=103796 RepID=A0A2V0QQZ5_PSESF|nr:periplasmic component [Pseudomonas syringae pv. actinidiae]